MYDGYLAFELDLLFRNSADGGYFEVAHDEKTRSHLSLYNFLQNVPVADMETVWPDVKNIDEHNVKDVKRRLLFLDARFSLKDKIIVETDTPARSFHEVSESGFTTSYYLPTLRLLELVKEDDKDKLTALAHGISEYVAQQKMSAVSFDLKFYPFVKEYLENIIDEKIVYYTWFPGPRSPDPGFIEKMEGSLFFDDQRVKLILVPYYSEFTL